MNKIEAKNVDFYYGSFHALKGINITIPNNEVVAFIWMISICTSARMSS